MADVAAFAGIRYNTSRFGRDISALVAPPYDVLGQADKDGLLARSGRNIVAIDLPYAPAKQAGPDPLYDQAGRTFQQWLADGTLARDPQPAMYLYHQVFEHRGRRYTRRMFLAAVRAEPFGRGSVLPHEQTFGGPKQDRLKLMQATQCNLSAVFGLYSDSTGAAVAALQVGRGEPDVVATLGGVQNLLWCVDDPAGVAAVRAVLADQTIYIADGHHRYSTALLYRDWLAGQRGSLKADHPAQFVLAALCPLQEEGLLILPTHRVVGNVPDFQLSRLAQQAGPLLQVVDAPAGEPEALVDALQRFPHGSAALIQPSQHRRAVLVLQRPDVLAELAPQRSPAWRRLGVAVAQRFLVEHLIAAQAAGDLHVAYTAGADEAVRLADRMRGLAVLVQPTRLEDLRAVCQAGELMPHKSTFFYPKLATGLVLNPLDDAGGASDGPPRSAAQA